MSPQEDNTSGERSGVHEGLEITDTFSQQADGGSETSDGASALGTAEKSGNLQKVLRRAAASGAVKGTAGRCLRHLAR